MKAVKLEEVVRQKSPELKQVVEQIARGRDARSHPGFGAAGPRP
ncbi:hypothetical protein C7378_0060 [Acidipila rosea]|uniref:Uncharacterized protein n=1 Tax=Acidipila rosea TaxID=768535 RepID=A0A4R1LCA8_9BACT|nr:hypothetical protein [Acidipila rosea]TCK75080.1 hypothetical protein C7378_0060 [Acidipila rosea]